MTTRDRSCPDTPPEIGAEGGTPGRWQVFRCLLPPRAAVADAFVTRGIGPLLRELQSVGELSGWSFTRQSPRVVDIHLLGGAPGLLAARLAGLCAAVGAHGPTRLPQLAGPPTPDLRLVDVAVGLIGMTPSRPARLGAAVDLTMVAAVRTCPALRVDDAPVVAGAREAAVVPPARWRRITAALATEQHPLTCWSRLLETHRHASGDDGAAAFGMVHLLHNQLGLTERDEQRVHAGLIRSMSRRSGGPRRASRWHQGVVPPGTVGRRG
ncbi:hypothetical protein AB0H28_23630 [Micromonospora sp. NPDC050980]|uniref:hypothetical protein n=1 Tax=Micromonospora sp. NPDC050980 TaxID=3155161 RepID=UPI0033C9CB29